MQTAEQAELVAGILARRLAQIGHPVHVITGYDGFDLGPAIAATFLDLLRDNERLYGLRSARHCTNPLLRRTLQAQARHISDRHIRRSYAEAAAALSAGPATAS